MRNDQRRPARRMRLTFELAEMLLKSHVLKQEIWERSGVIGYEI